MINKEIKIDFINFWGEFNINSEEYTLFATVLKNIGYNARVANCEKEECDIIFSSVFNVKTKSVIKGKPIIILLNLENVGIHFGLPNIQYDYSIGNMNDSCNNLYIPTWQFYYLRNKWKFNREKNKKNKFMTFISNNITLGNLSRLRYNIAIELNRSYKHVDFCGSLGNNIGYRLPYDMDKAIDFHKLYKFNLCFENSTSNTNSNYITEKIFNAFEYNTVPVYAGSDKIEELINPKAFINCNGKSKEEIIDIIKYYDNNDEAYYNMLSEPIFKTKELQERDWEKYIYNRITDFLKKVIK